MKQISSILLAIVALSFLAVSCKTAGQGDGRSRGISGEDTGFDRESVYKMQERTFRQLTY